MLRFLFWRMLGLLAAFVSVGLLAWLLTGGPGKVLRGKRGAGLKLNFHAAMGALYEGVAAAWNWSPLLGIGLAALLAGGLGAITLLLISVRCALRHRRCYVRLSVNAYRTDQAEPEELVRMFEGLHKRLLRRWWRRLVLGQPSVALEAHHTNFEREHTRMARRHLPAWS